MALLFAGKMWRRLVYLSFILPITKQCQDTCKTTWLSWMPCSFTTCTRYREKTICCPDQLKSLPSLCLAFCNISINEMHEKAICPPDILCASGFGGIPLKKGSITTLRLASVQNTSPATFISESGKQYTNQVTEQRHSGVRETTAAERTVGASVFPSHHGADSSRKDVHVILRESDTFEWTFPDDLPLVFVGSALILAVIVTCAACCVFMVLKSMRRDSKAKKAHLRQNVIQPRSG